MTRLPAIRRCLAPEKAPPADNRLRMGAAWFSRSIFPGA